MLVSAWLLFLIWAISGCPAYREASLTFIFLTHRTSAVVTAVVECTHDIARAVAAPLRRASCEICHCHLRCAMIHSRWSDSSFHTSAWRVFSALISLVVSAIIVARSCHTQTRSFGNLTLLTDHRSLFTHSHAGHLSSQRYCRHMYEELHREQQWSLCLRLIL